MSDRKLSDLLDQEAFGVRDGDAFSEFSREKLAQRLQEYAQMASRLERLLDRQHEGQKAGML